jgi:carbon-monoxide dehydrogenase small subunit
MRISVWVNERHRSVDVEEHHTLLEVLRDDLGLTGTKECCLVGECGACTVRLDDRVVDSCLVLAVEADGASVLTVEGLAHALDHDDLPDLGTAFLEHGAVQCGFCIPGQLLAGHDVLLTHRHPSRGQIEEGIAVNLCRCGCYYQIVDAIEAASKTERDDFPDEAPRQETNLPQPPVDQ